MNPGERRGLVASASAVAAAIGASSCCVLPLFLGGLGGSAALAAGTLEALRPYLLGASAALIGAGLYAVRGAPGAACALPPSRLQRLARPVLLASTVAVLAIAAFPLYAPALVGGGDGVHHPAQGSTRLVLRVDGMSCAACTVEITRSLRSVDGVLDAGVDYRAARAWILVARDSEALRAQLVGAVEGAGYAARWVADGG